MLMLLPTYAGAMVPHGFAAGDEIGLPPQFATQFTPRFSWSWLTLRLMAALALIATEVSCPLTAPLGSVTEIPPS
jgi:hypothetical protein